MDEAAWLLDENDDSVGTETGYVSGWWPYTSPRTWIEGLNPYGTKNDGASGIIGSSSLTGGDSIDAQIYGQGADSEVDQAGSVFWTCSNCWPTISTPRYNFAQGEVHAYDPADIGYPWLNNCSPGESFHMQYLPYGGSWTNWGNMSTGADSPYWVDSAVPWYSNGGC